MIFRLSIQPTATKRDEFNFKLLTLLPNQWLSRPRRAAPLTQNVRANKKDLRSFS